MLESFDNVKNKIEKKVFNLETGKPPGNLDQEIPAVSHDWPFSEVSFLYVPCILYMV